MRRRLYFLIPDLYEARKIFDGLLLKRVPVTKVFVLAKEGVDIGDLPAAGVLQKFDVIHSTLLGIGIGAVIGIIAGIIGHYLFDTPIGGVMVAAAFIGAILGGWSASMIGMMVPNVHLKQFQKNLEEGQLLFLVDVRKERVKEIEAFVNRIGPKTNYQGVEPTIPGFP